MKTAVLQQPRACYEIFTAYYPAQLITGTNNADLNFTIKGRYFLENDNVPRQNSFRTTQFSDYPVFGLPILWTMSRF